MSKSILVIRRFGSGWGIFRGTELVEGGFSTRWAAEDYRDNEYNLDGTPKVTSYTGR